MNENREIWTIILIVFLVVFGGIFFFHGLILNILGSFLFGFGMLSSAWLLDNYRRLVSEYESKKKVK